MPYFKERGQKKYEYEVAKARFQPQDLEPLAHQTYSVLCEIGAQSVRCSYNGGGDEGYAYLDEVVFDDRKISIHELKHQLAGNSLGDIPTSWDLSENDDIDVYARIAEILHEQYERLSRPNRVQDRFDRFARTLAGYLLGNPYGVGEFSMKGWFQADFRTGEIVDMRKEIT